MDIMARLIQALERIKKQFATAEQGVKADNALPASSYTTADVLAKLKTVDGVGSGLDADTLDSLHSTDFATAEQGVKADNALPASNYTANDVLTKIKTVDGAGSGLDADTLDGNDASAFAASGHNHSGLYESIDTNIMRKNSAQTMSAILTAQNNANYETKQVRNLTLSISDPSGGANGDIWFKYIP